jgi:transposase InsO family protein
VFARTSDGRPRRLLTVLDEFTRECLAIDVGRRLTSDDVLERLAQLFVQRGAPRYLRSDNGPEFTAQAGPGVARAGGRPDALYCARQSLGERLHRIVQREVV